MRIEYVGLTIIIFSCLTLIILIASHSGLLKLILGG